MPEAVPSECVVVRLEVRVDEMGGGATVAEDELTWGVLLSSRVTSEEVTAAEEEEGVMDEEDDASAEDDEAGPAEESAALLDDDMTLDEGTIELLDAELLDTGGWLEGGCEDSLGEGSEVALLGS